jgi:hypothetical protein
MRPLRAIASSACGLAMTLHIPTAGAGRTVMIDQPLVEERVSTA